MESWRKVFFVSSSVSSFDDFGSFLGERVLFSGICFIATTDLTKVKLERRVKILSFCSSSIEIRGFEVTFDLSFNLLFSWKLCFPTNPCVCLERDEAQAIKRKAS